MGISLEQAKAAARDAGIAEDDLTPEVLVRFQWEPGDALANVPIDPPAQTGEQLRADLALLADEARANSLPGNVEKVIERLLPGLLALIP